MGFAIKDNQVNGIIYDKEGFPILILEDVDGGFDIEENTLTLKLYIDPDSVKEIKNIFE